MALSHCTGTGMGLGQGLGRIGLYIMPLTGHTTQGQGKDPFPVPRSVKEPLFLFVQSII